jgi:putative glutamine transport system permease protein
MNDTVAAVFTSDVFWFLGRGLWLTLQMAAIAMVLAFALGTVIGIARYSGLPVVSHLAAAYVEAIRNSPLPLLILFMKFAAHLPKESAGIMGLTLFTAAMMAEIVRGGLNSIDKGQWEAARSQGFTYVKTLRHIVLPQALRKMIPPIFSQFITLLKDTSYVWWIGVEELTARGFILANKYTATAQFLTILGMVALTYYVLCHLLGRVARSQEKRMASMSY